VWILKEIFHPGAHDFQQSEMKKKLCTFSVVFRWKKYFFNDNYYCMHSKLIATILTSFVRENWKEVKKLNKVYANRKQDLKLQEEK
jgi:hypothetical protein